MSVISLSLKGVRTPDQEIAHVLGRAELLGGVHYRVGQGRDLARAKDLARRLGVSTEGWAYPTIIAEKSGKVIASLATIMREEAIIAGPLVVRQDQPHRRTVVRLIDAYDAVMRLLGVKAYVFEASGKLKELVQKIGMKPFATNEDGTFFIRWLVEEPDE